jgi:hypothetical protein
MELENSLPFADLVDWVEGRLSPTRAAEIAEMVARHEPLQRQVVWIRQFVETTQRITLQDPPANLRAQLRRQFRARFTPDPLGWIRRQVATLTLDSGLAPLAAGVRGADASSRQLIFHSDAADVILTLVPAGSPAQGRLTLHGQVLPLAQETTADSYAVQLLAGQQETALTASDELGEFFLTEIAPGDYELVLSGPQLELVLSPVPLRLDG